MSTKLNAEELAAKRFTIGPAYRNYWEIEDAYAAAIREIAQPIADERDELREALRNVTVNLMAAHSLLKAGGKKAAASDKMFEQMLKDYEGSFEAARAILKKYPKP